MLGYWKGLPPRCSAKSSRFSPYGEVARNLSWSGAACKKKHCRRRPRPKCMMAQTKTRPHITFKRRRLSNPNARALRIGILCLSMLRFRLLSFKE